MPKQTNKDTNDYAYGIHEIHLDQNQNATMWRVQSNDLACSLLHSVPYWNDQP